jgi:hypothetical protein
LSRSIEAHFRQPHKDLIGRLGIEPDKLAVIVEHETAGILRVIPAQAVEPGRGEAESLR